MADEDGRFTVENERAEKTAGEAGAEPVPVAEQRARGVAAEDTVTMADQRAPAQPQPEAAQPPAPLG